MQNQESIYLLQTLDKLLNQMKVQNDLTAKQQNLEEIRTMASVRAVSKNVEFNAIVDAKLEEYMKGVIHQERNRAAQKEIDQAFQAFL